MIFRDNKIDNCPVACDSIEYSAQLSYAQYPSNVYADQLAKEKGLKGTKEENRLFLRWIQIVTIKLLFLTLLHNKTPHETFHF